MRHQQGSQQNHLTGRNVRPIIFRYNSFKSPIVPVTSKQLERLVSWQTDAFVKSNPGFSSYSFFSPCFFPSLPPWSRFQDLPPLLRRTLNFLCAVPLSPPHRYRCLLPTMQLCCRWGPMWPGLCCKSMYILHNVTESDISSQCSSQHFHSSMLSFPACLGAA